MQSLSKLLVIIDDVAANIGRLAVVMMVLVTFFSVIGRSFFGAAIPDDIAISEIMLVVLVFVPFAYVQQLGQHIEITVVTDLLPEPLSYHLGTIGLILGITIMSVTAWVTTGNAVQSYVDGDIFYASLYDIPIWPAKFVIPLGLWWWVLRMALQLLIPAQRPEHLNAIETAMSEAGAEEFYNNDK